MYRDKCKDAILQVYSTFVTIAGDDWQELLLAVSQFQLRAPTPVAAAGNGERISEELGTQRTSSQWQTTIAASASSGFGSALSLAELDEQSAGSSRTSPDPSSARRVTGVPCVELLLYESARTVCM